MRSNKAIADEIRGLNADMRQELIRKFKNVHPTTEATSTEEDSRAYTDKFIKFVRYQFPELVKKKDSEQKPKIPLYIHEELYEKINAQAPDTPMSTQVSEMFKDFLHDYESVLSDLTRPEEHTEHAKTTSATVPREIKQRFLEFVQKRICLSKSEAARFILFHMYLRSRTETPESHPFSPHPKGVTQVL